MGPAKRHQSVIDGFAAKQHTTHKVYVKSSERMDELGDASIDLVVTSPPYWNLKKYGRDGMGPGEAYGAYLESLRVVLEEAGRVLRPGRFAVINIGTAVSNQSMKPIHGDVIRMMEDMAFTFKKEIIWVKPKGTQGLWQRGTTKFLKKEPWPCHLSLNIQHEYILIFQKEGDLVVETSESTRLSEELIKKYAWSVWEMRVSRTKGHPAPYPEELPRRIIELFSTKGERVLDPFGGTGTTARVAMELGRCSVTYEINPEYVPLIRENLSLMDPGGTRFEIVNARSDL